MSWNPQQQAMLAAMGYTLYRQAGAEPASAGAESAVVRSPVSGYGAPEGRRDAEATAGQDAPRTPRDAAAKFERLLQALVRASGGRDAGELPLPPLEQLRDSAQAKRALWPVLRALRRRH